MGVKSGGKKGKEKKKKKKSKSRCSVPVFGGWEKRPEKNARG